MAQVYWKDIVDSYEEYTGEVGNGPQCDDVDYDEMNLFM